jgi:hypothetical protein
MNISLYSLKIVALSQTAWCQKNPFVYSIKPMYQVDLCIRVKYKNTHHVLSDKAGYIVSLA